MQYRVRVKDTFTFLNIHSVEKLTYNFIENLNNAVNITLIN
jgi:hypothetical protein